MTVGLSGTGGGMKKFAAKEVDITGASRPIKPSEREKIAKAGVDFIELPVAYDGIAVVVNPKNKFINSLTVDELKRLWQPDSTVKYWSDLRKSFPRKPIKLYGPGADSGTFDYFTKAIVGKEGATRSDFTASEDDNVLVQGVSGDEYALGYFGFAYYVENKDRLKVVSIDTGEGAVRPSAKTIEDGSYKPLSRPIFIYVNKAAAKKPEVEAFVQFYIKNATKLVPQVGYVPMDQGIYKVVDQRFATRMTGTVFGSKEIMSAKKGIADLLVMKGE